jgi:hypothetical protein
LIETKEIKMSATNRRVTITTRINSQEAGDSAVKNRHYIVGSIDPLGQFSVATNPVVHVSSMTAAAECDRLAGQNPGKTFVVMQLSGGRRVPTSRVVL